MEKTLIHSIVVLTSFLLEWYNDFGAIVNMFRSNTVENCPFLQDAEQLRCEMSKLQFLHRYFCLNIAVGD